MQSEGKEEAFQGYLTKEEQERYIKIGEEKGEKIGMEKVRGEEREEIAKTLIKLGETPEYIEKVTKVSKEQIAMLTTTII